MNTLHGFSALVITSSLLACAQQSPVAPGQRYRCEQGVEFNARFKDDAVQLDTSRGYEILFRSNPANPAKPHEYSNAMMSVEFELGANRSEAVLRYPLLPLVLRCVKE